MASPFLGQIGMFGFTFAPRGWAFCNGQILGIAQNSALFALVGTTYGGNGQTTFALPDLQSRVPVHFGQGPGLSPYVLGQQGGAENVTLLTTQIPAHTHALNAFATTGAETVPANGVPANTQGSVNATANTAFAPAAIGNTGSSQPHTNIQPYLALNFSIALEGVFPSRN
ncbi:MAG: phage tail protein [Holophagales bacterium]|nr:phage tail protein [Holophagales bacterium]